MMPPVELQRKPEQVFTERQAGVLTEVIATAHNDLVRASDFNELKTIVRDLAAAQQRTELRVEELATTQRQMAESLQALAVTVQGLAVAQQRTERSLQQLSRQVGGID